MWLTNTEPTKRTQPFEGLIKQLLALSQREYKVDCVRKNELFFIFPPKKLNWNQLLYCFFKIASGLILQLGRRLARTFPTHAIP